VGKCGAAEGEVQFCKIRIKNITGGEKTAVKGGGFGMGHPARSFLQGGEVGVGH